jgi:drug/metabolite transporter (DMT)-like permease
VTSPAAVPKRPAVPLLVALLCLIWGSTWIAIRFGLQDQPPLSSAAVRFLIAGAAMALLTPWLGAREASPPPSAPVWIAAGTCNFAISYGVLYIAETVVPSGIAAVLWAVFPLLMAGSGALFLSERLDGRKAAGFLVSFLGIATMFLSDLGGIGGERWPWALLLLTSPVVAAIGTTVVKRFGSGTSSVVLNRNGMLLGGALLAAAALLAEDPLAMPWTGRALLALGYLSLVGTALAFGVYFWLLRHTAASRLSLIAYVTPALALLLGAVCGDGELDARAVWGTALVVGGVVLVVAPARRR